MKITTKDFQIEITIGELKELLDNDTQSKSLPSESSNTSPIENPESKYTSKKINNHNQKVTIEQIKQIKDMAEKGLSNKMIAETLGIKPSLVPYWRKHTPKDYEVV